MYVHHLLIVLLQLFMMQYFNLIEVSSFQRILTVLCLCTIHCRLTSCWNKEIIYSPHLRYIEVWSILVVMLIVVAKLLMRISDLAAQMEVLMWKINWTKKNGLISILTVLIGRADQLYCEMMCYIESLMLGESCQFFIVCHTCKITLWISQSFIITSLCYFWAL